MRHSGEQVNDVWGRVKGGLIVSCQALPDEPLHGHTHMAAMARAAAVGGAVGIRANGPEDIAAIRRVVSLPLFGLYKATRADTPVYITPTLAHARAVAEAGADVVALDATARPRPEGKTAGDFVQLVKSSLHIPVLADVSTLEEGLAAEESGADAVSTTLAGYTPYSRQSDRWDEWLVRELAAKLSIPLIAEGRIWTPEEARRALDAGAFAVVVGSAITRPQLIAARFVRAMGGISEQ